MNVLYIYIFFHLFVLSNSANCKFCKFLLLIQVAVNLAPTAHFIYIYIFSKSNHVLPLLFTASYKANNHYMSKLDVESCFFVFILDFLPVIYVLQNYYYKKKRCVCSFCRNCSPELFCKKGVLRNVAKFKRKHLCQTLLLINFIKKEALAQVFSCENCKISQNTFSYRTAPVAASDFVDTIFYNVNPIQDGGRAKRPPCQFFFCNFCKRRGYPPKRSDFQFYPFCHTDVKFQVLTQCQSLVIELEPRPPIKKAVFLVKSL